MPTRDEEAVFVEASARLHFGVLDLRGTLGRWFGGIGASTATPTLLVSAARADHLVARGADINAQWNGFYPIILASCEALAPRALRWLLDRGADPNAISRGQPDYGTALDMAIATYDRSPRQSECVNALIEAGGTSKYSHLPSVLIHRRRVDLLSRKILSYKQRLFRRVCQRVLIKLGGNYIAILERN